MRVSLLAATKYLLMLSLWYWTLVCLLGVISWNGLVISYELGNIF